MVTVLLCCLTLALTGWTEDGELTHRAYLWVDGKPLKRADGKAAPLEVWGLTAPVFVDSSQRPTQASPVSIRFSIDEAERLGQLAESKKRFLIEFHVMEAHKGKLRIRRVVRFDDAAIELFYRVMPGHGREGGLANRPFVGVNLSARSVEAGPPEKVKPTPPPP